MAISPREAMDRFASISKNPKFQIGDKVKSNQTGLVFSVTKRKWLQAWKEWAYWIDSPDINWPVREQFFSRVSPQGELFASKTAAKPPPKFKVGDFVSLGSTQFYEVQHVKWLTP